MAEMLRYRSGREGGFGYLKPPTQHNIRQMEEAEEKPVENMTKEELVQTAQELRKRLESQRGNDEKGHDQNC